MLCGIWKRGACLCVIALAEPCLADLPLMIEDLLTKGSYYICCASEDIKVAKSLPLF